MAAQLPTTYKGLLFKSASEPPTVTDIPTPQIQPGTALIKMLYSWVMPYANEVYTNGNPRNYNTPFPVVGGGHGIGRVAALGPDATRLAVGDLVTFDVLAKSRDAPEDDNVLLGLFAGFTPQAARLASPELYHHGVWAELAKLPLENLHRLDEAALATRGVRPRDLAGAFGQLVVPYGGLSEIALRPGERVLITPATGTFGGAAVHVALALGARVIAGGRNASVLAQLKALDPSRVDTIRLDSPSSSSSSSPDEDFASELAKLGPYDALLDLTPGFVANPAYLTAAIAGLSYGGRAALMGGPADITIPYLMSTVKRLTIKGKILHSTREAKELVRLIETGALRMGQGAKGWAEPRVFRLEEWDAAIETAAKEAGPGVSVLFGTE